MVQPHISNITIGPALLAAYKTSAARKRICRPIVVVVSAMWEKPRTYVQDNGVGSSSSSQ